jgi:acyl-CoA dehydrogenase
MIIFGQGAIRCHPFAYQEVKAIMAKDYAAFDKAFWGHVGHVVRNACRSVVLSVTRGRLAMVPGGPNAKYWRRLAWSSASFAIMSDVAMGSLGGSLKMKEKLTGRYADVLSWMYLASATLRRYEAEGYRADHKEVVEWAMRYSFHRIQEAFDGIFANFDVPVVGTVFRLVFGTWSRINSMGSGPSDRLGHKLSAAVQVPGAFRDSLTQGIPLSAREGDAGWRIENAFRLNHEAGEILHRISEAVKAKKLPKKRATALVKEALAAKVITDAEAGVLEAANAAREDVIHVDSFALDEFEPNLLDVKRETARARLDPVGKSKIG